MPRATFSVNGGPRNIHHQLGSVSLQAASVMFIFIICVYMCADVRNFDVTSCVCAGVCRYWLGNDLEAARQFLSAGGGGSFNFRDIVSWWSQSIGCNWLFLLDDIAFKQRHAATEIFLRNDPQRLGKVSGDKLTGVIRGLRSASLTKKTEEACLEGLDPNELGYVNLNGYIVWLCQMRIIYDRKLVG